MEKKDIRVRFTRKTLQDSLLALMKEKSILDISIKDICNRAGLSRSTFYTYYKDQYDLLRQIEEQTSIEADKIIQPYRRGTERPSNRSREAAAIFRKALQFIADNSNSIQVLLSENGDNNFQKKYIRSSIEKYWLFTKDISDKLPDKKSARYDSVFIVSGVIALVQEWLKDGMDIPVPEMAKILTRLIRGVLG
jgi:AcrR family transcriptional regulator